MCDLWLFWWSRKAKWVSDLDFLSFTRVRFAVTILSSDPEFVSLVGLQVPNLSMKEMMVTLLSENLNLCIIILNVFLIHIYPIFSVDDAVGNLHPLGFRRFLSLFQLRFIFQHFHLLNNVVCELTSTVI